MIRYCHNTIHISIHVSGYDYDMIHIIYAIFYIFRFLNSNLRITVYFTETICIFIIFLYHDTYFNDCVTIYRNMWCIRFHPYLVAPGFLEIEWATKWSIWMVYWESNKFATEGNDILIGEICQMHTTHYLNSLWPSDAIRWQRSGSTLAQVMACCLTAPSHYLYQCWLIISKIQLHPSDGNFTRDTSDIND